MFSIREAKSSPSRRERGKGGGLNYTALRREHHQKYINFSDRRGCRRDFFLFSPPQSPNQCQWFKSSWWWWWSFAAREEILFVNVLMQSKSIISCSPLSVSLKKRNLIGFGFFFFPSNFSNFKHPPLAHLLPVWLLFNIIIRNDIVCARERRRIWFGEHVLMGEREGLICLPQREKPSSSALFFFFSLFFFSWEPRAQFQNHSLTWTLECKWWTHEMMMINLISDWFFTLT